MAVIAALQGNGVGECFLVAPVGARSFPAALSLQTDTGTADVTPRASPDAAGLVFSDMMHCYDRADTGAGACERKELGPGTPRSR
jgi:hypothetical protein